MDFVTTVLRLCNEMRNDGEGAEGGGPEIVQNCVTSSMDGPFERQF